MRRARTSSPASARRSRSPRWRRKCRTLHRQLIGLRDKLEAHYKEVQDFEFTIEKGRLYCLQTRNGKMNARAMVITSVEMSESGLISRERALTRINPTLLEQLLVPTLDPTHKATPLAQGLPASPGAASGRIVFDADTAEQRGKLGDKVILVREETKPEDIHGFFAAQAILTSRGGKTSHAAVVARGMGKPCVSGCEAIRIDVRERRAEVGGAVLHEGDVVTIDGTTGNVYAGEIPTVEAEGLRRARHTPVVGRRHGAASRARQRRHAARRRARAAVRRDGHRAFPHRADVQRQRRGCRSCRR